MRLEDAVVIVDEAHNLVDAVNGAHSAAADAATAAAAAAHLDGYWTRFSTRLSPGGALLTEINPCCLAVKRDEEVRFDARSKLLDSQPCSHLHARVAADLPCSPGFPVSHEGWLMRCGWRAGNVQSLQALMSVARKLAAFLQPPAASALPAASQVEEGVALSVNDFLFNAGLDNVNLFAIVRCCHPQVDCESRMNHTQLLKRLWRNHGNIRGGTMLLKAQDLMHIGNSSLGV